MTGSKIWVCLECNTTLMYVKYKFFSPDEYMRACMDDIVPGVCTFRSLAWSTSYATHFFGFVFLVSSSDDYSLDLEVGLPTSNPMSLNVRTRAFVSRSTSPVVL
jgi:hypothetical protein